jgi:hypothetical protein
VRLRILRLRTRVLSRACKRACLLPRVFSRRRACIAAPTAVLGVKAAAPPAAEPVAASSGVAAPSAAVLRVAAARAAAARPLPPAARRSSMAAPARATSHLAPKPIIAKPARHSMSAPRVAAGASRLSVAHKPAVPSAAAAAARSLQPLREKAAAGALRPGQVAPANLAALPWKPKTGPVPGRENKPKPAKFDLAASLAKKPTWQPKSGALAAKPAGAAAASKLGGVTKPKAAVPSVAKPMPLHIGAPSAAAKPLPKTPSALARRASMVSRGMSAGPEASAAKRLNMARAAQTAGRRASVAALRARC